MIFGDPRWYSQRTIYIVKRPKYSSKAMEKAFQEVTDRRGERSDAEGDVETYQYATKSGTCSM